jgi:type II secretory pathway pseudopilin PulG
MKIVSLRNAGYSLIEMAAVIVLMVIISGLSLQAIMSSTDLFFTATRDYLEVYQESRTAMEKIVRELRESYYKNITFTSQTELIIDKKHATPMDADVEDVRIYLSGDTLMRESDLGPFVLADNVSSFSASTDINNVITLDITSGAGGSSIHLRTAVWTRQTQWK